MFAKIKESISPRIGRLLLLMGGCFFLLITLAFFLEDIIGKKIVAELQSNIRTELQVGDVSFSLISSFPYASLNLKNIVIKGNDQSNMLKAGSLRFKINILSLFDDPIKIKAISIRDGVLLMKTDENGATNYDIIKPGNNKNNDQVAFVLEKATLKNIIVGYQDEGNREDAGFTIKNATFKGALSEKKFNLSSSADLVCHGISRNGKSFLVKKNISYKTDLKVDRIRNKYNIGKFSLALEDNKFDVQGKVAVSKKITDYNLRFRATDCNIGSLLAIFPQARISDLSSEGNLSVSGTVKGVQSAASQPDINAEIRLVNGTLKSPKLSNALESVNFTARLNTKKGESYLALDNFSGFFGKQPLQMKLNIKNFSNPYVNFSVDGKLPLAATYKAMGLKNMQSASGFIALKQVQVSGFLADMRSPNSVSRVNMSGTLGAEHISMVLNNESISLPVGLLRFNNNTISAEGLDIAVAGSRFTLAGYINNLLPALLRDSPQQSSKLGFRLKLQADNLDAQRVAALFQEKSPKTTPKTEQGQNAKPQQPITSLLSGVFEAKIENLSYGKIKGKHFDGSIGFQQDGLTLNGKIETMRGKVTMNGKISVSSTPYLTAVIDGNNIDTGTLFEQCEDFGQQVIQSRNISGRMDCQLAINVLWDRNWNVRDDKLNVLAYLRINDGRLQGLNMMDNLSKYVKTEDLRNIRFNTLENWFEVSNKTIRIPAMNIRSNALNLTLSGTHTFDNYIDYNIKLNAADVVLSRFKKPAAERENREDAGQFGLLNVFFNLNGPIDNYKVQMSRKVVKNDFEESNLLKSKIQSRLKALHNGKEIPFADLPTEAATQTELKTVSSNPKTAKKKIQERAEEKLEYIEGF